MNGIHDMGGMTSFGPVPREETSPFHAKWENRFAVVAQKIPDSLYSDDEFRYSLERLDPVVYLASAYYERWLAGIERLLLEKGVITEAEMTARVEGWRPQPGIPPAGAERGHIRPAEGGAEPRYAPGDRVRVRDIDATGHTRAPRYVRGRRGVVERFLGAQTFPDDLVAGRGERLRPVYAVRFTAHELWGDEASPRDSVLIDLWEDYLQPDKEER
jgi:nitrile hydratase